MNFYLKKYGFQEPVIIESPEQDLGIIVVIPCFDEPDLTASLKSLNECIIPKCSVEVIVVLNAGEHHSAKIHEQNLQTAYDFIEFQQQSHSDVKFHLIQNLALPKKHAGVGLARKVGMDEAVARFDLIDKDGIIVCFDADALVEKNYLTEIESHFELHPNSPGCSIYYEHPLSGKDFSDEIYSGIINYELHLRYYNQCLFFAGLPFAFHTVGSSMAVRSSAYQKQGGMNKRKAGEDFYFIHKIIALGNFTELKTTKIIPSPRISDRVPFGTGKAIGDWIDQGNEEYFTYSFEIFEQIHAFVQLIPKLYEESVKVLANFKFEAFKEYLNQNQFTQRLAEIKSNTKDFNSFQRRFYVWFDAFQILKLVHFLRDNGFPNGELLSETQKLLQIRNWEVKKSALETLIYLREIEKS